jgi:hypothetical protein
MMVLQCVTMTLQRVVVVAAPRSDGIATCRCGVVAVAASCSDGTITCCYDAAVAMQ